MARKRKSPVAPPEKHVPDQQYDIPGDAPWGGFINIRLDEEQRTEFYNWYVVLLMLVETLVLAS